MPSRDSIAELRSALAEVALSGDRRSSKLKRHVFTVVDELKRGGLPPERVIVTLKSLLAETPSAGSVASLEQTLVDWCFERYYSGAHGT
jgi:hypothetical protein